MTVHIREATSLDRTDIYDTHLRAFPEIENQLVATLALNLLRKETNPETIALVAETGGSVVGHIAFSPVTADTDRNWLGYILAPLGVRPEHGKSGTGSKLVEGGIELLSKSRVNVLYCLWRSEILRKVRVQMRCGCQFHPTLRAEVSFRLASNCAA